MDLLAMRSQMLEAERTRLMQEGQHFRCLVQGHLLRNCPTKGVTGKARGAAKIAELEDQIRQLTRGAGKAEEGNHATTSKMGEGGSGLKEVPTLSQQEAFVVNVGASEIFARDNTNPRLYVQLRMMPTTRTRFIPPVPLPTTNFLIDSGATHNVLSASYALKMGLMPLANPSKQAVTGFDGSQSQAGFDIELILDNNPNLSTLIITTNIETLRYATKSSQSSAAQRDPTTSSDQIAKAQRRAAVLLLRAAIFFPA
ncbi:hypothetical protein PCANC_25719 [Puccinia coronata f. sp. avenae]|uniref:Peptidase A2 domain-containing protein n=1 Tax=Puccinia coronata f. sp. avenae TaxID=200324 RepID=A0A2N5U7T4_9BASI|nr:hypothetical protein PCANC_25719 [Puccinia coronata f. sp. avenae]